jgi:two-component system chemotaxis response regulator CheY
MAYNILIVDDSAVTRALIKRTIKLTALHIGALYEAANGNSGLELLATHSYSVDLVLVDLHMPGMGGDEMIMRILADEKTRDIPVVIISAEPDDEKIAKLKGSGVKGHLRKPFTPEELSHVLTELLGVAHD